jgi:hypothetical protein
MLAENFSNHGGHLMFAGQINKTSPQVDIWEVLSGTWNQYTQGEWRICKTPFFLVITATLDRGQHALPFTFDVPVAGTLVTPDGEVKGVIIRPLETAIDIGEPGLVTFQVFGDLAKPTALR